MLLLYRGDNFNWDIWHTCMAIHSSQSYYIYKSNFLRYYKLLMECRNCERLITALTINFFLRKILLHFQVCKRWSQWLFSKHVIKQSYRDSCPYNFWESISITRYRRSWYSFIKSGNTASADYTNHQKSFSFKSFIIAIHIPVEV